MSNALAIAAVTATIEYFLNLVFNHPSTGLGTVTVSALAPDIVQATVVATADSKLHVNLFLHQVTLNTAWRNAEMPSLASDGMSPLRRQPLALDLHYLLTAYASEDIFAEALLGFGILMLHENPVLPRNQIRAALSNLPSSNVLASALNASGLADQVEMIKMIPSVLNKEEMAWLWTALKADYRPTYPFQVSVVLIDPRYSPSIALPVLSPGISVQSGPPAQIFEVQPPNQQIAAAPGDTVMLTGQYLSGASNVALVNSRLGIQWSPFAPAKVADTAITFVVPDNPAGLPAGVYNVSVQFANASGAVIAATNSLPIPLAPAILSSPPATATANSTGTLVALSCKPQVLTSQSATLILGSTSAQASPFAAATAALTFQFQTTLASGSYLARLRIDGVESPVSVDWTATPPVFKGPFISV